MWEFQVGQSQVMTCCDGIFCRVARTVVKMEWIMEEGRMDLINSLMSHSKHFMMMEVKATGWQLQLVRWMSLSQDLGDGLQLMALPKILSIPGVTEYLVIFLLYLSFASFIPHCICVLSPQEPVNLSCQPWLLVGTNSYGFVDLSLSLCTLQCWHGCCRQLPLGSLWYGNCPEEHETSPMATHKLLFVQV